MVDYNYDLLNHSDLMNSFFHLDKNDPTSGFAYDASTVNGHTFPRPTNRPMSPPSSTPTSPLFKNTDTLDVRLQLGSHLAAYLRHQMDEQKGYTATVGISTNKLISKLVGNVNKPNGQTTLVPPYSSPSDHEESNVTCFIDGHDIGKIPGIGFKIAQKIRNQVLGRPAAFEGGLVYGPTKENVTVRDVRLSHGMGSELLEKLLGGSGSPKGIGGKTWGLINGVDDTDVAKARSIPRQISIEDSYIRLDTIEEVKRELTMLANSLIKRMYLDLTEVENTDLYFGEGEEFCEATRVGCRRRWLAHPRTLRLTTRPRPPLNADGTRARSFHRISRSGPTPAFLFNLKERREILAARLLDESLMPMFRKLHPEKSGWNLSLVNLGVTHMVETATVNGKDGTGRDISNMLRRQHDTLKEWKIEDRDIPPSEDEDEVQGCGEDLANSTKADQSHSLNGSEDAMPFTQDSLMLENQWEGSENGDAEMQCGDTCEICGAVMPSFAVDAHARFHALP
ncbi:hypothetical protein MMC06_002572 [Schaereria dolodes]|nr:hypothetical protein [Schaereria dolodes]